MTETRLVQHFINGTFVDDAPTLERRNPSDVSDVVVKAPLGGEERIGDAVAAARKAQPGWAALSPEARGDVLDRASAILMERSASIGELLSREEGKTLGEGVAEVGRAARILRFFGGEALRASGIALASTRPGVDVETIREPIGVVGLITPWNFPIAIPVWKAAPALAFGNAIVLKPSELTPLLAHIMAEVLAEAGLPNGVMNIVYGDGRAGAALASHPDLDGVSFTGSVATGARVAQAAMESHTRIQCEMGGKNAMVVLDDADLDLAVATVINASFFSTGQKCTASSRLVVTDGIYDRFTAALTDKLTSLRVGHALDPNTQLGPLASAEQLEKTNYYLGVAKEEGATIVSGAPLKIEYEGHYAPPSILLDTNETMRINQEEVFGPVASVIRTTNYESALDIVNSTKFGLSAGIMTNSLKHARHFRHHAKAGLLMVNLPTAGVDYHVPFGGTRRSNIGPREQGREAVEFYTHIKTCYTLP